MTECQMRIRRSAEIEAIRIPELLGIAVGRIDEGKQALPLQQLSATELHIGRDDTHQSATWPIIPQPFLDGGFGQ